MQATELLKKEKEDRDKMKLKSFRLSQNMSQEKFAREIGVSLSMMTKVENGKANASKNFLDKVKKRFPSIDLDEIFFA